MNITQKKSVSKSSSCEVETDNLQSSSDSKDNDESSKDCLSKNTSPRKSDTSAINPSSNDSYNSSPDTKNTAVKLSLLSISGDGSSVGHVIDKGAENTVNNPASSPSSSVDVIPATARPALKNLNHSDRKMKFVKEGVKKLNTGSANTSTRDFTGPDSKRPSGCSDSGRILVKSSSRAKSELPSKALLKSEANPRQAVKEPCSSSETDSQAHMKKTMKSFHNRDRRQNPVAPRFAMKKQSDNAPLKNSFQHITKTNSSIPPSPRNSSMARNPTSRTYARVTCSETLENSNSSKSFKSSALASSSLSAEDPINKDTLTEQNKSNLKLPVSSRASTDCSNSKASNSNNFNRDVETPRAIVKRSCNLSNRARNVCLPELKGKDYFSNSTSSDSSSERVNLPCSSSSDRVNSLFQQGDSRNCRTPTDTQSTDSYLRTSAWCSLHHARSSDDSFDTRSVGRLNSNLIELIDRELMNPRPGCLLSDQQNVNMPSTSAGAYSKPPIRPISAKSNSASTTFQSERLTLQPSSKVHKLYDFPGDKNKPSNFTGTNISTTPSSSSSPNKAYRTLNSSTAWKSSDSGNMSPLFQKANDALGSLGSTHSISNSIIRNDTHNSIFKENKSPSSSQKRNDCFKSQEENKWFNEKAENISPSNLALKTPMLFKNASPSRSSSSSNVFGACAENRVKTANSTRNPFSSQSFSQNYPEHLVLNNSLLQTYHKQPVSNNNIPHTSAYRPAINSATSRISDNRPVSNSAALHTSADFPELNSAFSTSSTDRLVSNSGMRHTSAHLAVVNSIVPHSSTDLPVSNRANFDSSTNLPVLNHAIHHTFHGHSGLSNTVADTSLEPKVLNNVPYRFSDRSDLNGTSSHTFPDCPVLDITISHNFPEHPVVSYTLHQDSFNPPVVNTNLSHFLSEFPVLNLTYSPLGLNDSPPALFETFPDRPVLHVSLTYNHPEHPDLIGISHNFSDNAVLNIAFSGSFSEHPVSYNAFNRLLPPNTYLGEPVLTDDIRLNYHEHPILSNALPQTANPNGAIFSDSFMEQSQRCQTYSTQSLQQARIPQFPSPASTYQPFALSNNNFTNALCTSVREQYPSQPFSNIPIVSEPTFSNQSAYLQPGVFDPQGYPVHSFPTQYSYHQFPQQAYHPQAGYHWSRHYIQIETDSDTEVHTDTDRESYTDTDQGVYTDTDQEIYADPDQEVRGNQ